MPANGKRQIDGQIDFSGGVNSAAVKTIVSGGFPSGLHRNQLAWLINGTVRGGGITQRTGWQPLVQGAPWSGLYQGGYLYQPDYADPYLVLQIGGRLYQIRVDTDNSVTDLSTLTGINNPPDVQEAFFSQANQFLVIQAGDYTSATPTNPLFWVDNLGITNLRRSNGFVGVNDPTNEIPPAGPMDFYMQRLWYAFGRNYAAGDISVNTTSGTIQFNYQDSVLHVTENPIPSGGDAFIVPTSAGNIRALAHASNLDSQLGEANLCIFTPKTVYTCAAPITRADWIAADNSNMPLQKVALVGGGSYSARGVVPVNGDLFFPSPPDGDIRSLIQAIRNFGAWGNVPLSRNENRVLDFNDRSLLRYTSGMEFDNRLWMTELPVMTPAGAGFRAVVPLDFDVISTLEERYPPAWEGVYEGLNILQLFEGDFGGRQRAFAVVWSDVSQEIQIWELTVTDRFENGQNRVRWVVEFPAYTWGDPFQAKELDTLELWVDKMLGTVDFAVYYRPDNWPCWIPWHAWNECTAKDCLEDVETPCSSEGYPETFCESFRATMRLPKPPATCIRPSKRPSTQFFQCQFKLVIKGWCRVRGILAHAYFRDDPPYEGIVCGPLLKNTSL